MIEPDDTFQSYLKKVGVKQLALSIYLEIDPGQVSLFARGMRALTMKHQVKIAKYLHLTIDDVKSLYQSSRKKYLSGS